MSESEEKVGSEVSVDGESVEFNCAEPQAELERATEALKSNDLSQFIEIAEAFLSQLPDETYGYILLAIAAEVGNERSRAIDLLNKAHELDPECREVVEALSNLSFLSGNMTDGVYFAKLLETLSSNQLFCDVIPYSMRTYQQSFQNMQISQHYIEAMRAYSARDYNSCVDECVRELRQNNHHKFASELLGYALLRTKRAGRAIPAFQTAIHLNPKRAKSVAGLGEALLQLGRVDDAKACFYRALDMDPDDPVILAQCQRSLARIPGVKREDLKTAADAWLASIAPTLPSREGRFDHDGGPKLRVGIVSDMFHSSPTHPYFSSLIEHCDRSKVEIRLYSLCQLKDSATSRLRNITDTWREVHDIDQFTLGETLAREDLDVIIDLCFEPDEQAIELFTVGAAKNQVSWLPQFEAASLLGMTHVLSDARTQSVDQSYLSDGQTCVTPANGILARQPFVLFDEILPSPVAETKAVMFGMRADPAAITQKDAFMIVDLLRAVPGARLMLGLVERLDQETQARLLDLFSMGGAVNLVFFQELPGSQENEKMWGEVCNDFFRDVDIFLSPASSVEFDDAALSLWMGVPVVSMQGASRMERLFSSVLEQAERGQWIAKSGEEFVEIGKSLALDPKALTDMRQTLREDVKNTPLFDTAGTAGEIWKSIIGICEG